MKCARSLLWSTHMYPQYMCTRVICAQEPCICAQENYSLNIHPNARMHIYTIHTYKFIHHQYLHIYKSVYACSLSWYYLHPVILLHTLPDTALINKPSCASLRSRCGFIFEKHRTSRKSALYKEPSIRKRTLYLHKRTLHLRTRAMYMCTKATQRWYAYRLIGTSRRSGQCARCSTYIHTYCWNTPPAVFANAARTLS